MDKGIKKRLAAAFTAAVLLLCCCGGIILGMRSISGELLSQRAAERWRGGNELPFAQHSMFVPAGSALNLGDIYSFRYALLEELNKASVRNDDPMLLFRDAWCCFDELPVSGEHGSGLARIAAVGGSFFDFHPLQLLSGSYISDGDFSRDRVVLDRESAWLLFGSAQVAGLTVNIDGLPFTVAGVVDRERDYASLKANPAGMYVYMSYDTYCLINERDSADCYEIVMPEPVEGFGDGIIREQFPVKSAMTVNNSMRFTAKGIINSLQHFMTRSVMDKPLVLPYWENAARINSDRLAVLAAVLIFVSCMAVISIVYCCALCYNALIRFLRGRAEEKQNEPGRSPQ